MNVYETYGDDWGGSVAPESSAPSRCDGEKSSRNTLARVDAAARPTSGMCGPAREIPANPMDVMDDHAWVAKIRSGDEDAAHALVQRLYPTILRCIRGRLHRYVGQDDVVQTVFVKIFGKLSQFRGSAPLEHWAARIAVNTCINQSKCQARRQELRWTDLSEIEKAGFHHAAAAEDIAHEHTDNIELLASLMNQLNPEERKVIHLLHIEERSMQEISRLLGLSVGAVKIKAFRTRSKMRKLWERSSKHEKKTTHLSSTCKMVS